VKRGLSDEPRIDRKVLHVLDERGGEDSSKGDGATEGKGVGGKVVGADGLRGKGKKGFRRVLRSEWEKQGKKGR
jgi:hypothetical protein